jgi:hypothetical protein
MTRLREASVGGERSTRELFNSIKSVSLDFGQGKDFFFGSLSADLHCRRLAYRVYFLAERGTRIMTMSSVKMQCCLLVRAPAQVPRAW